MRKIFIKLFAMTIIASIITFFLCFESLDFSEAFAATEAIGDMVSEAGNNPGVGEFFAIFGTMSITADIFVTAYYFGLIIGVPFLILIIMSAAQLIALLFQIGEEKRWKLITGKVFTCITTVFQVLLCLTLLFNIFANEFVNIPILIALLVLNIILNVIYIMSLNKIRIPKKTVLN